MKLQLNQEWFEKRIQPNEEFEVGAGVPGELQDIAQQRGSGQAEPGTSDEEFADSRSRN